MITQSPATGIPIRATYDGEFSLSAQPRVMLCLSIARAGPYALVGWVAGEEGGTSLFRRRGEAWCRTLNGGGALRESDIIGFDGIDERTARKLFSAKAVLESARAR